MESSCPNKASDNALESSVFPTPVGPRKRNEPIGRFGAFSPTRPRLTAFATAVTASSWPITRLWRVCSSFWRRIPSDSFNLCTGTFVHTATTDAISSSVTVTGFPLFFFWKRLRSFWSCFCASSFSRKIADASSRFPLPSASSIASIRSVTSSSRRYIFFGTWNPRRDAFEQASSMTSIALSGRNLSLIYRSDNATAVLRAASSIYTWWCSSYLLFNPCKILRHCPASGSSTVTGWNLRSSAASFSIYFLYSVIVVAPISWSSPLASEGFSILDASIAPSAPPAPIIVCTSSRNRITFPAVFTSRIRRFRRSSNSPRYLEPAIMPARSIVKIRLSFILSGTIPDAIHAASPSTTAVFPTPGSPTRHGLFFVLRLKTCIRRCISSSLPITGSSFPSSAWSVRSVPYWQRTPSFPFAPSCIISSWYVFGSTPLTLNISW